MDVLRESQKFINLLEKGEDRLVEFIVEYAQRNTFAEYAVAPREAWRLSILRITKTLLLGIRSFGFDPPELKADENYQNDPVASFGQAEARKHRLRGVTLNSFLSMLKYYRQGYFDLIYQSGLKAEDQIKYCLFTGQCFDRIELGYISEWTSKTSDDIISDLQTSNRHITNDKNKYLSIFESLFTPVIVLDEKNKILNFNLEASGLFRDLKTGDSLIRESNPRSLSLQIIDEQIGVLLDVPENERVFETEIETLKGKRYFKVVLKKSLDVLDDYIGTIVMLQDLTEQHITAEKMNEAKLRAEEADKLKTSFLANMSHEIRTPMNAIVGFTELMLNENYKAKEQKDFLRLIQNSSRDLLHIIEDIIDIAKLESNQLKVKYKPCRIFDILSDLNAIFSETLRRYGTDEDVNLILKVNEEDKNLSIFTDGERLKQVITNFLSNAAKFTSTGFIEFGYRVVDNSNLLFFVRDSGTGIPASMKEKVFDRFFQLNEHQSMNYGGAGLGLAICRNIVALMGGKIWMDSVYGKGSDFFFQLPYQKVAIKTRNVDIDEKSDNQIHIDLKSKSILIAEDDEMNFTFLKEILSRTGVEIHRAENGLEAINIAESKEKIDLILMDIKMPEVNGLEASKYIAAIRPDIPIIAQTAFAMEGDKKKCLEAGCCAYITKPICRHKLFLLLERYILSRSLSNESVVSNE